MKKTKIIATLGPVSESKEMIETLILSGVDVFRMNFSHGTHEEHGARIDLVRQISKKLHRYTGILADLQGPKIRIGEYDGILANDKEVTLVCGKASGNEIPVQYLGLCKDVKKDDRLMLDDGLLEVKVTSVVGNKIRCKVVNGGHLTSKKGINLATGSITADVITDKDKADAIFALSKDVDFLGLSFVRDASDIKNLRKIVDASGKDVQIIAKIERHEAVGNFEEILEVSDVIMVARGDLGVEVQQQRVPLIQKHIIKRCLAVGKPSIVATQMLDSMIRNPRSTRAETSDIVNAILDGADAIMLSGETAVGSFPTNAVRAMNRISLDTEKWLSEENIHIGNSVVRNLDNAVEVIAQAAFSLAEETNSKFIVAATESGYTALAIAKHRPNKDVVAITEREDVAQRLSINWGIIPQVFHFEDNTEMLRNLGDKLVETEHVKPGDQITLVSGRDKRKIGGTNIIRIYTIE